MLKVQRPERSELLMPAGSLAKLKTAVLYGADAIYCGTPDLSLRTKSAFSAEELIEGIEFAHKHGVRVYLTLNLFTHNKDIEKLPKFVETIRHVNPDGVIVADPAVFQFVKENAPEIELHVSTQANICSYASVNFWKNQGASLVVLAREVSFEELKEIREKCPDVKLEAFVHGAMCMTYSGRCLLSNFMSERGANQGNCAQSCRWKYKLHIKLRDGRTEELNITEDNKDMFEFLLEEQFRPGEFMPIEEDLRGSYILNAKDLCLMPVLNEYLDAQIDSLKVEGRHKNEYYAGAVARAYRKAIDDWYKDPENWRSEPYMRELNMIRNRGYSLAFHKGRLENHAHDYDTTASLSEWTFGGFIREWDNDNIIFELKNELTSGDVLEFLPPTTTGYDSFEPIRIRLYEFINAANSAVTEKVSAGQNFAIRIPKELFHAEDLEQLKDWMPAGTVARRETSQNMVKNDARTKVRIKSHQAEAGKISEDMYETYKAKMEAAASMNTDSQKSPKLRDDGCCGLGCNGCLIFWNDDKYAKARDILQQKKMGTRLDVKEKQAAVS